MHRAEPDSDETPEMRRLWLGLKVMLLIGILCFLIGLVLLLARV